MAAWLPVEPVAVASLAGRAVISVEDEAVSVASSPDWEHSDSLSLGSLAVSANARMAENHSPTTWSSQDWPNGQRPDRWEQWLPS